MNRTLVNLLIDACAALLFLAMLATGYILHFPLPPGTNKSLSLWGLPRHGWGEVHFWVSLALLAVVLGHLALHWQWVVTVIRRQLHRPSASHHSLLRPGLLAALAVGGGFLLFAWATHHSVRELQEPCCAEGKMEATPVVERETAARKPLPTEPSGVALWKEVRSIFETFCLSCHGPKRARGGFRVDRRADFFQTDLGKPFVVPGNSAASPLLDIVSGARQDIAMPERHRLSAKEQARVKAWIDAGAPWPEPPKGEQAQ